MTLEELATLAQHQVETIRRDMATKDELHATGADILRAIEGVDRHLWAYSSHWGGQLEQLDQRVQELDKRLRLVENTMLKDWS